MHKRIFDLKVSFAKVDPKKFRLNLKNDEI